MWFARSLWRLCLDLRGAWWILFYYAVVMLVCNIGGEELWWRGYVLPRQELAFCKAAWVVHGIFWSAFHLFMQASLWDTVRRQLAGLDAAIRAFARVYRGVGARGKRRKLSVQAQSY
jgi:membrane protease YdiL (CAAX protease family)